MFRGRARKIKLGVRRRVHAPRGRIGGSSGNDMATTARAPSNPPLRAPPGRLPARGRWAMFLDLDGSLTELAPRPEAAALATGTHELLERLHATLGGALALLSGRPVAALDAMLDPLRLPAAGLHGLERRGAAGHWHRA